MSEVELRSDADSWETHSLAAGDASHVTLNGARWVRFDPRDIREGGAYLLVRSVHDNGLYVAPRRSHIPFLGGEESGPGLLNVSVPPAPGAKPGDKPKRKTGKMPVSPPSPSDDEGPKPKSKGEGIKKSQKAKGKEPERPAGEGSKKPTSSAQPAVESDGKMHWYICPVCSSMHGHRHVDGCEHSDVQWGQLSKHGKAQREAKLNPKAKPAAEEKKQDGPKGKGKEKIEQVDPLNATTKDLSQQEEKKLRKFFGLKPPAEPSELEGLPPKERAAKLKLSTIPKWAVAATKADRENLSAILSGSLNSELFQAGKFKRQGKALTQDKIVARWAAIKLRFEGVPLLEKPRSKREVAFKKEYDALKKEVGEHPCLPKPKKGNGAQGGRTSPVPQQPQGQPLPASSFLEMMKTFAEVMKALR